MGSIPVRVTKQYYNKITRILQKYDIFLKILTKMALYHKIKHIKRIIIVIKQYQLGGKSLNEEQKTNNLNYINISINNIRNNSICFSNNN